MRIALGGCYQELPICYRTLFQWGKEKAVKNTVKAKLH